MGGPCLAMDDGRRWPLWYLVVTVRVIVGKDQDHDQFLSERIWVSYDLCCGRETDSSPGLGVP